MEDAAIRLALAQMIEESGSDYAGLSRLLGRNPAYIQQFIKRGTPRRLAEEDRRRLADYFGVAEDTLGGPSASVASSENALVRIKRLAVGASAGSGALGEGEDPSGYIAFDPAWLRRVAGDPSRLSLIRVQGDSMLPALADGDEILVDHGDAGDRLRNGIYVLRMDGALMVKRIAPDPAGRTILIRSDNKAYPSWPNCDPAEVDIVGRVIWAGGRL